MYFDYKKTVNRSFLLLTLMNLVTYACFHSLYNLSSESAEPALVKVLGYLDLVMSRCCDFMLPVIIASVALLLYGRCGGKKWLIYTFSLSTSVIFYSYPYYYVYHVEMGFTTSEGLGLALLASVISTVSLALHALILFLIVYLYVRFKQKCAPRKKIAECMVRTEKLDFTKGPAYLLFIISLCEMIYRFATEIFGTVEFFIDFGLTASNEEILTMILSYVLIICLFAVGVFVCDKMLRYKLESDFYEVVDDVDDNQSVG